MHVQVLLLKKSFILFIATVLVLSACQKPGPEMVKVPAGWFLMGENDDREPNRPQHRVYLDAFEIQRTEVTRDQFAHFVAATGYEAEGFTATGGEATGDLPVIGMRWRDADAYCRWIEMRLPTEAEWEKAARGEDGRRYPWGNTWDLKKANTAESGSVGVLPVGSFPQGASPYGLLDMCGNAAEWVADYYDAAYYQYSPDHNPTGPEVIQDHGLRGGSFASSAGQATTYFRDSSHSARPNLRVGFRCAR